MRNAESGADYRVLLGLSGSTALSLIPFTIHHFVTGNWAMGVGIGIGAAALWLGACALYIWRHRTSERVGVFVILAAAVAVLWSNHQMGDLSLHWGYVLILGIYYILPLRPAFVMNLIVTPLGIALTAQHVPAEVLTRLITCMALVSVFAFIFSSNVQKQRAELTRLATFDPLTGVRNRRALTDVLEDAHYQRLRHNVPAALLIFDIDHFKAINDRHGHQGGDAVLVAVADRLRERVRRSDGVFRYGGEEFVVLATHTTLAPAAQLAEKLRGIISADPIPTGGRATVSCGVAELLPGESREDWLKRADDALYQAKAAGRDRVVVSEALPG